jgi:hypothetical protein
VNSESIIEALKALHVKCVWTFYHRQETYAGGDGYDDKKIDGCRICGGRTENETIWPCETRAILDKVEGKK